MKICLLNDSFPPVIDGVANVVLNYAKILNQMKDCEVMVGTPYYPGADYSSYPFPVKTYLSLDTSEITGGYRAGYPFPVKEIGDMAAFKPDIIHTHCPVNSCFIARSLRDASEAPIILTYHTKYDIDIRNTIPPLLQDDCIKALVNNVSACDEVWAVSKGAGESLQALGYEGDFIVMPNGVDFPKGRCSDDEVRDAVKGYDLPENLPVFLYVGRLMNYKGLPMIIDALYDLAKEKDFRMVFIGQGADSEILKKKIREYGLSYDERTEDSNVVSHEGPVKNGKIIFTGPVRERNILRAWNTRADLFVFPSTFDTNGLVVREAAACGLAGVLIRGSCAAEDITGGRNGFLIDENKDSLAAFLKHACDHTDELHAVGEHAMDEIYLSWEEAVNKAAVRYREILELKASGRLKPVKKLADDPLYEMAGDAVRRYLDVMQKDLPAYEGMRDNYANLAAFAGNALLDYLDDALGEIGKNIQDFFDENT